MKLKLLYWSYNLFLGEKIMAKSDVIKIIEQSNGTYDVQNPGENGAFLSNLNKTAALNIAENQIRKHTGTGEIIIIYKNGSAELKQVY